MPKLVFCNADISGNRGAAAQLASACSSLRMLIPDLRIVFLSRNPEADAPACHRHGVKVAAWQPFPHLRILRALYALTIGPVAAFATLGFLKMGAKPGWFNNPVLRECATAEMVIDLAGDGFRDSFSSTDGGFLHTATAILMASAVGRPVVLFSQSIGPFAPSTVRLARYCLDRASAVMVREEASRDYLAQLGCRSDVYPIADCAFLLQPVTEGKAMEILASEGIAVTERPLVGLSMNADDWRYDRPYPAAIVGLVDSITSNLGARVVIVPQLTSGESNDRAAGKEVMKLTKNRQKISLIAGDYTPEEIKGVTGIFDAFITGRTDAAVTSLASGVPTLVTAGARAQPGAGVMDGMGQAQFVWNTRHPAGDLERLFSVLWQSRRRIRAELQARLAVQKNLAWQGAWLIKAMLDKDASVPVYAAHHREVAGNRA